VPENGDITVSVQPGGAHVGVAARVPHDMPREVVNEIRRLLLAEDAMLNVAAWARSLESATLPADRRARVVAAAGMAAMFWRPFVRDDDRRRLEPGEWRERIADNEDHARLFDRIEIRRAKVLAHVDTNARVVNVTDTYRFFQSRDETDPRDLRVYDVGADGGLLEPDSLRVLDELATRLAQMFSDRMVEMGAVRVRQLYP
jgi:hypothetical protein